MMPRKKQRCPNPLEIIAAIEVIAEHALSGLVNPDQKALGAIYQYAHITWERCQHPDWEKQFWKEYRAIEKAKLIDIIAAP